MKDNNTSQIKNTQPYLIMTGWREIPLLILGKLNNRKLMLLNA
jgi:hypothetical protein